MRRAFPWLLRITLFSQTMKASVIIPLPLQMRKQIPRGSGTHSPKVTQLSPKRRQNLISHHSGFGVYVRSILWPCWDPEYEFIPWIHPLVSQSLTY